MEDWLYQAEKRRKWLESLPDGVPCDHRGCLSHISHPCEVCGRIGGKRLTTLDGGDSAPSEALSTPEVNPLGEADPKPPAAQ